MKPGTEQRQNWQRRDLPLEFRAQKDGQAISTLSVRMENEKPKTLSGYGAVFYRESEPGSEFWLWDDLVERLMPGCFDRSLKEDDIRSFFNHDANRILARRSFTADDTLRLSVDEIGLRYELEFDAGDPDHVSVFGKVRTRKVSGSSFMFVPIAETYRSEVDPDTKKRTDIIEVTDVLTYEVGPVVFPAYEATSSEVRRRMRRDLAELEREANERRRAVFGNELQRFRHRVEVDSVLRSL
jgi:HK97 family phage prohead protease